MAAAADIMSVYVPPLEFPSKGPMLLSLPGAEERVAQRGQVHNTQPKIYSI